MKKLTFTLPFSTKLFATGTAATGASIFADFIGIFQDKFILYIAIIAMFIGVLSYWNSVNKDEIEKTIISHFKLLMQYFLFSFLVLVGGFLILTYYLNIPDNIAGIGAMALSYNADKILKVLYEKVLGSIKEKKL